MLIILPFIGDDLNCAMLGTIKKIDKIKLDVIHLEISK